MHHVIACIIIHYLVLNVPTSLGFVFYFIFLDISIVALRIDLRITMKIVTRQRTNLLKENIYLYSRELPRKLLRVHV